MPHLQWPFDSNPTWLMPVVRLQAGQYSCPFLRLATAMRPHFSHTCTRYASLWSNSRSCGARQAVGGRLEQPMRDHAGVHVTEIRAERVPHHDARVLLAAEGCSHASAASSRLGLAVAAIKVYGTLLRLPASEMAAPGHLEEGGSAVADDAVALHLAKAEAAVARAPLHRLPRQDLHRLREAGSTARKPQTAACWDHLHRLQREQAAQQTTYTACWRQLRCPSRLGMQKQGPLVLEQLWWRHCKLARATRWSRESGREHREHRNAEGWRRTPRPREWILSSTMCLRRW